MNKITIEDSHIEILKNKRVFTNAKADFFSGWLKVGVQLDVTKPIYLESYSASFVGPNFSNLGAFSYTKSYFPNAMKIGRYCAIAAKVTVMPASHPMNRLSTVGFDYSNLAIFEYAEKDFLVSFNKSPMPPQSPLPVIENDVWIGHDVVICRGVRIGTGAVIASKSVVTKDVPPYAVVAGVPAVVKKYRFNEKLCERLIKSDWWHYKYTDFAFMNTLNPEEFLDKFENQKSNELLAPFKENRFDLSGALKEVSKL